MVYQHCPGSWRLFLDGCGLTLAQLSLDKCPLPFSAHNGHV